MDNFKDSVKSIYDDCYKKVIKVRDVFIDQFGEQNVDLKGISFNTLWGMISSVRVFEYNRIGRLISCHVGRTLSREECDLTIEEFSQMEDLTPILREIVNELLTCRNHYIVIKWDTVEVTNEHDNSVVINDLFAKLKVSVAGYLIGSFELVRTTYPESQWLSHYSHSHLPTLEEDGIPSWHHSCLGTGPISSTIGHLASSNDENFWKLFAYELSKYVTVESLSGGPYISLEEIHPVGFNYYTTYLYDNMERDLLYSSRSGELSECDIKTIVEQIFLRRLFVFTYVDGHWAIGNSTEDVHYKLSNLFIDLYNHGMICKSIDEETLKEHFFRTMYKKGQDYIILEDSENEETRDYSAVESHVILVFKGQPQRMHIIRETRETTDLGTPYVFLRNVIVTFLLRQITLFINLNYGKQIQEKAS